METNILTLALIRWKNCTNETARNLKVIPIFFVLSAVLLPFFCVGIKKLEKSLYEEHGQMFFGYQPIASLQLCSMNASKDRKTGYYKIMHEVQLRTA